MDKLISHLLENGIYLSGDGDKLNIEYNGDSISKDLLQEIKKNKNELLEYLGRESLKSNYRDIVPVKSAGPFKLSSAQRRLWVLNQFEEGSQAYNMPGSVYLNQEINIDHFKKAIDATIERHEILRTVFKEDETNEVKQWILNRKDLGFKIDYKDFRKEKNKNEKVSAYIAEDAHKPFDLVNGPLLRAALLQTGDEAYVFYYNIHHIIGDGWSMDVLASDVLAYYDAYKENKQPALKALRIQYKDYSAWQLAQLEEESFKAHRAYWLKSLSGELPLLDLPGTKQRPRIRTSNGHGLNAYVDKATTARLKKYSEANGGSLFIGLLAVWNILMYRYTSQKDIIIGSPVAGREHADLEDQIGFYVNILALRNEIDPEESFNAFYQTLKNNTLKSYNHQMYPFDRLVEELDLARDSSRSAVFDVMLALQNVGEKAGGTDLKEEELNGVVDLGYSTSKFDIEMLVWETGDYLSLKVLYNADVYERKMIEGLISHYKQLLHALLESPGEKISQINYLSQEETHQLQVTFNDTEVTYPTDKMIVTLFEEQVKKTPDKVAVIFEEKELTYRELDAHANRLARYLQKNYAIEADDLVGILQERSGWMVISILAVWKAGGAYVPMNSADPAERTRQLITSSNLSVLITNGAPEEAWGVPVIDLNKDRPAFSGLPADALKTRIDPGSLAYVIYTSGSTGRPKGVMIEHMGMINHIGAKIQEMWIDSNSKVAQNAPHTFDISVWQFFSALLVGGSTTIYEKETILDPSAFIKQVDADKISTLELVPSYLLEMLSALESGKPALSFAGLKILVLNAETLTPSMVARWFALYPHIPIVNTYGATEASDDISHYIMYECPTTVTVPVLKRPIQNFHVHIVDEQMQLVPVGVKGEILLSGPGVGRGYLNDEEQTKRSFLKGPLPGISNHTRIYRTGDLARYHEDGTMEFLGRRDSQVKINGHRVELGEIEHALRSHKEIEEVVVLDKENQHNEKELVAYIVAKEKQDTEALRAYLKDILPEYMLPAYYVQLEVFPLTANGKINKKLLPEPEGLALINGVKYIAPGNEIEEKLVRIWEEVLKRGNIGIRDDFFSLGGHSLKIIKVINQVNKQFGLKYDLKGVFTEPTIESMARQIKTDIWFKESKVENDNDYNEVKI